MLKRILIANRGEIALRVLRAAGVPVTPGSDGPVTSVDSCLYNGCELSPWYDSLAAKLMVHAPTRLEAIRKMRRCLEEFALEGFPTNGELSYQILYHPTFIRGDCTTAFLDEHLPGLLAFAQRVEDGKNEAGNSEKR